MDVGLLGPVRVAGQDGSLGPRDRVVLSVLALRPGEDTSVERIADALWPGRPPETWPKVVQGCVARLRRSLGAGAITTTAHGYRLEPGEVRADNVEFERLVEAGRQALDAGDHETAVRRLQAAVSLWRGAPFAELEEWPPGRNEAARIVELRLVAEEDLVEAVLRGADPGGVVPQAKLLVAEQPLREHRWALLARAQYRAEQQAEALDSIRQARRMLTEELGLDLGEELSRLEAAILAREPSLSQPGSRSDTCPYKGLPSYDEADRDVFFGRSDEVATCLDRLSRSPLLVLVGPSGCGKSSLMRAGIAAALTDRGTGTVLVTPGADPAASLAAALARSSDRPVLLIDQFEESFTLTASERQRTWLAKVADYALHRAPVVLTVRADHVAALGQEAGFARLVEQGMHLVPPLTGDNLRAAVELPATHAGLEVEPGLVDLVERDVEGEPGALPLMSHALAQTWAQRSGNRLTVAGYRAAGGIRGALSRSAERLYEALDPGERRLLRGILLRLVVANEDGDAVPTRYPGHVLQADPARARLVELLVQARLVTAEDGALEIAHEALARAWPRLRSWLDEDAEGQRVRAHLASAALGWESLGRDPAELYTGARLAAAVEWAAASDRHDVTPLEQDFLDASLARASSERAALEARARDQARQNRRLRGLLAGAVTLALLAAGMGTAALLSSRDAARERDRAGTAEGAAQHEALVNRSLSLRPTNRSAAALLAVEAYRQRPDAQARSALLGTFTTAEGQGFLGYRYIGDARWVNGTLVPGTDHAVLAVNGRYLRIVDRDLNELPDRFPDTPANAGGYSLLKVNQDGRLLLQLQDSWVPDDLESPCGSLEVFHGAPGGPCSQLMVYDLHRQGELLLGPFHAPFFGTDAALNDDGTLLAVTGGPHGDLAVYRVPGGDLVGRVRGHQHADPVDYAKNVSTVIFDSRDRVYVGSTGGEVSSYDGRTLRPLHRYDVPPLSTNSGLALTGDGMLVAAGSAAVTAVDTATGRRVWTVDLDATRRSCPFLAVADTAGRFYCGNFSGQIAERELATGGLTGRSLDPQLGSVGNLVVSDDGKELVSFNDSGPVVSRWRLDGSGPVSRSVAAGQVLVGGYDPAGRRVLVADPGHLDRVRVWDVRRDRPVRTVDAPGGATWVTANLLAVFGRPGGTALVDVRTGQAPTDHRHPIDARTHAIFADYRSGTYFIVTDAGGREPHPWVVRRVDAATGDVTGHLTSVAAYDISSVSASPDGVRVLVTSFGAEVLESSVYDVRTGKRLASGLPFQVRTAIGPDNKVVGANPSGPITQFDLDTFEDVAEFPGSKGEVTSLQFSDDGRTLMVTAADQSVQLYDVEGRIRLGDPLIAQGPSELAQGYLRRDGAQVAVTTAQGVSLWHIDTAMLRRKACDLAGRNLTALEQTTYLDRQEGLLRTCRAYPQNTS